MTSHIDFSKYGDDISSLHDLPGLVFGPEAGEPISLRSVHPADGETDDYWLFTDEVRRRYSMQDALRDDRFLHPGGLMLNEIRLDNAWAFHDDQAISAAHHLEGAEEALE